MPQPQTLPTLSEATPEEFLPPIRRWVTLGGLALLLIAVTSLVLSARFKYRTTVKAPVTLRPIQELFVVQTTIEGIVKTLEIQENQRVQAGDILATLENIPLETQSRQLENSIQQLTEQSQHLQGQLDTLNAQMAAETQQFQQSVLAAEAQLQQQRRAYQDRQVTTQAALREAEANYRSTAAALEAARSKRDRYQTIAAAGALSLDEFAETQLEARQQEEALQAAQARIEQTRAALNPAISEVEIAQARMLQATAQGEAHLASLQQDLESLKERQAALAQQRQAAQQELVQVRQELDAMTIRSPVTGVVQRLHLYHSEQRLQAGSGIAEISISDTPLELEAQVTEADIPQVKVGQTAQVRINGCPYTDYGVLTSQVTEISPDIVVNGAYGIVLQPASGHLTSGEHICLLQAGMEGQADIVTREETILWALLRKARLITDL